MKAPDFWSHPPGLAARMLTPFGWAYDLAGRYRRLRTVALDPGVPVLCVGNLVAGGAGKTPVTLAVADLLCRQGIAVHLLTRGYRGRLSGPVQVVPGRHDALQVGDEPLLLAKATPTWVARDRAAGAIAAVAAGAEAIVLDDGFQNPALCYRLALVVVDGTVGFGNGRVIPAGPLREPIARGLSRASALVILGHDRAGIAAALSQRTTAAGTPVPLLHARLVPDPAVAAMLRGRRLVAFAGIGRPAKFFESCHALGAELVAAVPFPDHHCYRPEEITALIARARTLNAVPVTTAKDAVRLPEGIRSAIQVLPVAIEWQEPATVTKLLEAAVARSATGGFTPGPHPKPKAGRTHV